MVEIDGRRNLAPACATYVTEGMNIKTTTPRVVKARRTMVELLLSDHPKECLNCEKTQSCDLQKLASALGVRGKIRYEGAMSTYTDDASSFAIYRDLDKCILCRRCETMCNTVQTCGILSAVGRGFDTVVAPAFNLPMIDTMCTFCGQCVAVCPTGALTEMNDIRMSGMPSMIRTSMSSSRPLRPSASPSAKNSAWNLARSSRAKWPPPCAASVSTMSLTPTLPLT
jgi:NADH dehydrogenase/NADH:ubiquinone oxidoreductase subunit G